MRILYWTELFWPHIGGVEVLSMQLITALQKRGYEFIVVTSHSGVDLPDEAQSNGIPIYRFHFPKALANRNLKELKAIIRRVATLKQNLKPDLLHINSTQPSIFFHHHTSAACPAPTLFTIHESSTYALGSNTLIGRTLHSAQWVVAISEAVLLRARQIAPQIAPRSSVIYYGLEMPVLQPAPLSFDTPFILCLGRVVVQKGFDLALDAFARLVDRFPSARLVIAGGGPARPDLEQQAARLGLTSAVEFTGWVAPEDVPALINTATVVVMPSRPDEAFGLVALQAAQMARPVVATRVGGIPEIVVDQQTGLLVEEEDSAALAEGITFLLEHPEVARQMGQAARRRAKDVFSLERFVDDYDTLYQRLKRIEHGVKGSDR